MGVSNRSDILTSPIGKSRIKSEEDEEEGGRNLQFIIESVLDVVGVRGAYFIATAILTVFPSISFDCLSII